MSIISLSRQLVSGRVVPPALPSSKLETRSLLVGCESRPRLLAHPPPHTIGRLARVIDRALGRCCRRRQARASARRGRMRSWTARAGWLYCLAEVLEVAGRQERASKRRGSEANSSLEAFPRGASDRRAQSAEGQAAYLLSVGRRRCWATIQHTQSWFQGRTRSLLLLGFIGLVESSKSPTLGRVVLDRGQAK